MDSLVILHDAVYYHEIMLMHYGHIETEIEYTCIIGFPQMAKFALGMKHPNT